MYETGTSQVQGRHTVTIPSLSLASQPVLQTPQQDGGFYGFTAYP